MKYLLLNPILPSDFDSPSDKVLGKNMTVELLEEAAEEYGCTLTISKGFTDKPGVYIDYYYLMGNSLKSITRMVNEVDLEGIILAVDSIYDPSITEIKGFAHKK